MVLESNVALSDFVPGVCLTVPFMFELKTSRSPRPAIGSSEQTKNASAFDHLGESAVIRISVTWDFPLALSLPGNLSCPARLGLLGHVLE